MNITGISEAVIARIKTDTGSGGVWQTAGTYKLKSVTLYDGPRTATALPLTAICPYLVIDIEDDQVLDGFIFDMQEIEISLHLWDTKEDTTVGAVRPLTIRDRLFGDGLVSANRQPSYGLHRHPLTLTTTGDATAPWATGMLHRTGSNHAHELDCFHFIDTYRVNISRVHS